MQKITLVWSLNFCDTESVERYCPNCGRRVLFSDTQKKRRNARGKQIYEYTLFRCSNGHTWQRKNIGNNSLSGKEYSVGTMNKNELPRVISLCRLEEQGYVDVEIILKLVNGAWRLDKTLSQFIRDMSRSRIQALINERKIRVDGRSVKPGIFLRGQQRIDIYLGGDG